jgi:hypothetical protein
MARRKTRNVTGLARLPGVSVHHAWVAFVCLKCSELNLIDVGTQLPESQTAFETARWPCRKCGYTHRKEADLPFTTWPREFTDHSSIRAQRFWLGFFRIATEHSESYWKQCNTCGRILPFSAFSKHAGWGPLERQMECRSCKGAINAELNPRRTRQQLHEASARRRVADLLLEGENQSISPEELFARFGGKCFKTKKPLSIKDRKSWAIDHILPSRYLYPLTRENAALLSAGANNNKRDRWPSEFYTNNELIELSRLTGADLSVLASRTPIVNPHIDVNACVSRFLKVRERSDLPKRLAELKKLLLEYDLVAKLSLANRRLLGFK